jgi:stage III sporulation protein AF
MPQGSVKKVGKLVGGLVLLLTISAPIIRLEPVDLSVALTKQKFKQSGSSSLLEIENTNLVKKIIAEQTNAYISDKAAELGIDCAVDVIFSFTEDGEAYPISVTLEGVFSDEQRRNLTEYLEREFAIPAENQLYKGDRSHESGSTEDA